MSENVSKLSFYECVHNRLMKFTALVFPEDGFAIKLADEDIVLSSGPKSGTTWAQQVLSASALFPVT